MSYIKKLNKKLDKMFDGQVTAREDDGCLVLSGELRRWSDIVLAGKAAVPKNPYVGVVNEILCTGEKLLQIRKPKIQDDALEKEEPDVLIIGGGVIGCAIARELSKYKLGVLLVEKEYDLAVQASGRSSGLVNSFINLQKGTLKYRYNRRGNQMFSKVCSELGVQFERCGQFLCFSKRIWEPFMFLSLIYWKLKGVRGIRVVRGDELEKLEPGLNPYISSALHFPETGITDPRDLTIAYAENAVQNGANIVMNTMVQNMTSENGVITSVKTNRGTVYPKIVVNAAGVFSESIATLAGDRFFSIHPRKGTEIVLDKKYARDLAASVVTSLSTASDKNSKSGGSGAFRTIKGNVFVGLDAVETINREDFTTNTHYISAILKRCQRIVPKVDSSQIVTYFSGVSAATYEEDFVIGRGKNTSNIIHAAGIQSPGLTSAPAIGEDVAKMVAELFGGEDAVGLKEDFDPIRKAPPRPAEMSNDERAALIESDSDYGIIVCACEEVTKGEIKHALRRNIRCNTIDGVKRRVRAGMGRCQGAVCCPQVIDVIAAENRMQPRNIRKSGGGSDFVYGNSKELAQKRQSNVRQLRGEFSRSADLTEFKKSLATSQSNTEE